jgi:hypothetical protein
MYKQFDMHTYISHPDIFDELEEDLAKSKRRFSLSLPKEFDDDVSLDSIEESIQVPPAPPPSPTQRPTIEISDEDSYLNLHSYNSSDDEKEEPIKDIQGSLGFSKEDLLISSTRDIMLYKCPPRKSFDARKIWKLAKIPRRAYIREIETLLLDWAFTYAVLEISGKKIVKISWTSKSNCHCQSTWPAFIRWIICASVST